MPKGIPARIGQTQWIEEGAQVHANQIWPTGVRMAAMQSTETMASGATCPVDGSDLWLLIILRRSGSEMIANKVPTETPVKAAPDGPGFQPRMSEKMMGYATKLRYSMP